MLIRLVIPKGGLPAMTGPIAWLVEDRLEVLGLGGPDLAFFSGLACCRLEGHRDKLIQATICDRCAHFSDRQLQRGAGKDAWRITAPGQCW